MRAKLFQIKNENFFVPVLAVQFESDQEAEQVLLAQAAAQAAAQAEIPLWGSVLLWRILGHSGPATMEPLAWGDVKMREAHHFIHRHFSELSSGSLLDLTDLSSGTIPVTQPKSSHR